MEVRKRGAGRSRAPAGGVGISDAIQGAVVVRAIWPRCSASAMADADHPGHSVAGPERIGANWLRRNLLSLIFLPYEVESRRVDAVAQMRWFRAVIKDVSEVRIALLA